MKKSTTYILLIVATFVLTASLTACGNINVSPDDALTTSAEISIEAETTPTPEPTPTLEPEPTPTPTPTPEPIQTSEPVAEISIIGAWVHVKSELYDGRVFRFGDRSQVLEFHPGGFVSIDSDEPYTLLIHGTWSQPDRYSFRIFAQYFADPYEHSRRGDAYLSYNPATGFLEKSGNLYADLYGTRVHTFFQRR